MAKDHSEYLDEHYETFLDQPCFPALRMNPALFSGEVDEALSTSDEQLLLVLHCSSAERRKYGRGYSNCQAYPQLTHGVNRSDGYRFWLNVRVADQPSTIDAPQLC